MLMAKTQNHEGKQGDSGIRRWGNVDGRLDFKVNGLRTYKSSWCSFYYGNSIVELSGLVGSETTVKGACVIKDKN